MKLPSISYIIGVHNEDPNYIRVLLEQLLKFKDQDDEIIIVDDYSDNKDTVAILEEYKTKGVQIVQHALNNDFAIHKNYMNSLATKPWIFNIDCDEVPHENLLQTIKEIIVNNPSVDLYFVPRINIVQGLTEEDVKRWGWNVNELGYINYPDKQGRIYKNSPDLQWVGRVHERIEGSKYHTTLPFVDDEGKPVPDYCLMHAKGIEKQRIANAYYETL